MIAHMIHNAEKTIEAEIVKFDFASANNEFLVKVNGEVQIASYGQWMDRLDDEEVSACDVFDFTEARFTPGIMVELEEVDGRLELLAKSPSVFGFEA